MIYFGALSGELKGKKLEIHCDKCGYLSTIKDQVPTISIISNIASIDDLPKIDCEFCESEIAIPTWDLYLREVRSVEENI